MIDHLGFRVRDLAVARQFYEAVARALGLAVALDPDGNNIEAGFRAKT